MPAIAALTINDGATTPVAHVFNVVTTTGSKAEWADRSPGVPAGYLKFQHQVEQPAGQRTVYRITIGAHNPVMATVDGVPTVVRYSSAQVTLNLAPDSSLQERKDLLAYVTNFLANASVKTSVENIEPFY